MVKSFVHGMFVIMDWLNIMLVIVAMIKLVVSLMINMVSHCPMMIICSVMNRWVSWMASMLNCWVNSHLVVVMPLWMMARIVIGFMFTANLMMLSVTSLPLMLAFRFIQIVMAVVMTVSQINLMRGNFLINIVRDLGNFNYMPTIMVLNVSLLSELWCLMACPVVLRLILMILMPNMFMIKLMVVFHNKMAVNVSSKLMMIIMTEVSLPSFWQIFCRCVSPIVGIRMFKRLENCVLVIVDRLDVVLMIVCMVKSVVGLVVHMVRCIVVVVIVSVAHDWLMLSIMMQDRFMTYIGSLFMMVSWHAEVRLPCVVNILLHLLMMRNDSLLVILAVKSSLVNAMLRVMTELVDSLMSDLRVMMHWFVARHKSCMDQLRHLVINMLRTMVYRCLVVQDWSLVNIMLRIYNNVLVAICLE